MPPQRSPGRGGGGAPTEEQTAQLLQQMAESSQLLTNAVANLATSQASFMRSAADADANIGLSKAHPFIPSELAKARAIDNTVDNDYRNGLPKSARDTRNVPPDDFVSDPRDPYYDPSDSRHANDYGLGHDEFTLERSDQLNTFHRERGRTIRVLEKSLPADGYMNTVGSLAEQQRQWEAHPLTLSGTLTEGDIRKGEYTISKYLEQHRWYTEYGKAFNQKQFMLNLSTTHAEDLCTFASYDAYITGSNKVFYLHEFFKAAVWRDVESCRVPQAGELEFSGRGLVVSTRRFLTRVSQKGQPEGHPIAPCPA